MPSAPNKSRKLSSLYGPVTRLSDSDLASMPIASGVHVTGSGSPQSELWQSA